MKSSDMPQEVKNWLLSQDEPYTIFCSAPYKGLTLVIGSRLPEILFDMYERGLLKDYLIQSHYEEKELDGENLMRIMLAIAKF